MLLALLPDPRDAPAKNSTYWAPKLARNVQRDGEYDRALTAAGWQVVRVWEHEPIEKAVNLVLAALP